MISGLKQAAAAFGVVLAAHLFGHLGCRPASTPANVDAGVTAVNGVCSWLEGVTDNGTVISICATVEEVALIVATIAPLLRAEPVAGSCTTLPDTSVCATPEQIGKGISAVLEHRRALFLLDASTP